MNVYLFSHRAVKFKQIAEYWYLLYRRIMASLFSFLNKNKDKAIDHWVTRSRMPFKWIYIKYPQGVLPSFFKSKAHFDEKLCFKRFIYFPFASPYLFND